LKPALFRQRKSAHSPDERCFAVMTEDILSKEDIEKIIFRISIQILERNPNTSNLLIIGVKSRGDVLAKRLCEKIQSIDRKEIQFSAIDITFYRDDVQLKAYKYVVKDDIPFGITDRDVVLVDDVIFTGRSIRAAIDALMDLGRPKSIQLAVLIARGGRELPIQPDFVGKKIDDDIGSKVSVHLEEIDGEDKVSICQT
jgi:pyrimidine operon attenuation protein/uracil phosphoribosyltransferase